MKLSTLSDWLSYIGSVHSRQIELGLTRVRKVAETLDVLTPGCPVITVGGTNGKGSTVAGLEAIYRAANYRTGAFTSPYLWQFNEEIRIDGQMATDEQLCAAFAIVDAARQGIALTAFEFATLAALVLFKQQSLDVYIMEVGLGGRLDAVNILDADIAVITSIGIDHVEWLGDTREKIGAEKAGVFRSGKPVVCGDDIPPASIVFAADQLSAPFYQRGKDFFHEENSHEWVFSNSHIRLEHLPCNALAVQNMANVLQVIFLLQSRLPVAASAISQGLQNINLPGRIQIISGDITEIYDVAHNPAAMEFLSAKLLTMNCEGKTIAVFSMLKDKDIIGSIKKIRDQIDVWYVAPLVNERAASVEQLQAAFLEAGISTGIFYLSDLLLAYHEAKKAARTGDRIIIFGSFYTVGNVMSLNF